jgi:hypothetical protein
LENGSTMSKERVCFQHSWSLILFQLQYKTAPLQC